MTGVYAVYDVVAKCMVGPLIVVPNDAAARRLFQDALTGQGSTLASHPEDYCLFKVGLLDVETGSIIGSDKPFERGEPVITGDMVLEQLRRRVRAGDGEAEPVAERGTAGDLEDWNSLKEVLSGS